MPDDIIDLEARHGSQDARALGGDLLELIKTRGQELHDRRGCEYSMATVALGVEVEILVATVALMYNVKVEDLLRGAEDMRARLAQLVQEARRG